MKPFFSIRIDFNPADSKDETDRDCFSVRRSVGRQVCPCPDWEPHDQKLKALLRDEVRIVVQAIASCIGDLGREAKWTLPDLIEDIVFELANEESLEKHVISLAQIAVDGCEDDFLDSLQKLIDDERKERKQP